ncbi:hypothetical protein [Streptomyces sp. MUM 16J]|uniref:hypothetical protein n=1 Tax=Streptomyces sp. MUM 16J TaxID=2791988 RepID=UPI001F039066|nr:hypothetical protein [Streptomyces sp. MUM 16J]MCH0561082.1 hypothetical protein [Streptomyces sp. MUM 16J]
MITQVNPTAPARLPAHSPPRRPPQCGRRTGTSRCGAGRGQAEEAWRTDRRPREEAARGYGVRCDRDLAIALDGVRTAH